jgi:release factor glutamine methyltransferase
MMLMTPPGVFRPISDSWMLAAAAEREQLSPGHRALDLCTGSGVVAIAAARSGAHASAVDVSRRAAAAAWVNARLNGQRVRVRSGHLFDPVADERFELITSNPPYVPAPTDDLPRTGAARAWVAGWDGRTILDEICDRAPDHLVPGGRILLVHSSLIGEERTIDRLERAGLRDVAVVDRHHGPLGPLMREQQQFETIPADIEAEDVVVIRGVARG